MTLLCIVLLIVTSFLSMIAAATESCLEPLSSGRWTIFTVLAIPYLITTNESNLSSDYYLVEMFRCNDAKCQNNKSQKNYQLLNELVQSTNNSIFKSILLEKNTSSLSVYYNPKHTLEDLRNKLVGVYSGLFEEGHFFNGYFYDKYSDILSIWNVDLNINNLINVYEGLAVRSTLKSNRQLEYVTFKDKKKYTFQLVKKIDKNLWATDREFLFLHNNSTSALPIFNFVYDLIPMKIICKDLETFDLSYTPKITIIVVTVLSIAVAILTICLLALRKKIKKNKISNRFANNSLTHRTENDIEENHSCNTNEPVYTELEELNHYNIPGTTDLKAYDQRGRRVLLINEEPGYLEPIPGKLTYDYAYDHR